jgi:hypothetical protein
LVSIRLYPAPAAEIQVESLGLPNAAPVAGLSNATASRLARRSSSSGGTVSTLFDGDTFQAEARGWWARLSGKAADGIKSPKPLL